MATVRFHIKLLRQYLAFQVTRNIFNPVVLMLIPLVVVVLAGCTTKTEQHNWNNIYEEAELPAGVQEMLEVRVIRTGDKGREKVSYIEFSIDDRHYRLGVWRAPIYELSLMDGDKLVYEELPIASRTIEEYWGGDNGSVPLEVTAWKKFLMNTNSD